MFLFLHVVSCYHMIKRICDLVEGTKSTYFTTVFYANEGKLYFVLSRDIT